MVRHRAAGAGREDCEASDGTGYVERLGHPHAFRLEPSVQSIQLPDWIGLAARQRHHRTKSAIALFFRRCFWNRRERPFAGSPGPQIVQNKLVHRRARVASLLVTATPKGILMSRDELAGWLLGMNTYIDGARAFWLEA